ncbi:MAG: transcription termination/antitermination protein NusG [Eubacterium sp.]|nr:transcription termination/antitermination protein NusG [Eubacterium sp.]
MAEEKARWYVVHTYSGYEKKVQADIMKTIEHRNMQDQILEVMIPLQTVTEEKNGEMKQSEKKMFPAYVLIHMVMNEQTWYVVRNTRGVTGFVGPGSKAVPLSDEEVASLVKLSETEATPFSLGDKVVITSGVWADREGVISEVHPANQMAIVVIDMFGRGTPVEIELTEIKKLA